MPGEECKKANTCSELATELDNLRKSLSKIADIVKWTPSICKDEMKYVFDEGITKLAEQVTQCEQTLIAFQNNLMKKQNKLEEAYEEMAAEIVASHQEAKKRLENLPEIKIPTIQIPQRLKELIEIAERFDKLPDAQFTRVLELAVAMRTV